MQKKLKYTLFIAGGILALIIIILVPWSDLFRRIGFDPFRTNVPAGLKAVCEAGKCQVLLDGQIKGETPLELLDIAPGEHTIKLKRISSVSGFYTDAENKVNFIKSAQVFIAWELGPSSIFSQGHILSLKERLSDADPTISVVSTQKDIDISIDGTSVGQVPFLGDKNTLSEGKHTLTFSKEGFLTRTIEVEIKYKYVSVLEVQLMALPIQ